MLGTIRPKNQKPQLCRPELAPRRLPNQKPLGELGKKGNKRVEDIERLAPPQVRRMPPTFSKSTLARPEKPRKKPRRKLQRGNVGTVSAEGMLPKSRAMITTKRAIISSTALSRKTSGR